MSRFLAPLAVLALGAAAGFGATRIQPPVRGSLQPGGAEGGSSSAARLEAPAPEARDPRIRTVSAEERVAAARATAAGGVRRAREATLAALARGEARALLEDDAARLVCEAIAATTRTAAEAEEPGLVRISGHARTSRGTPVAGVRVEVRRRPTRLPAPPEEEAVRRMAGALAALDDPIAALEQQVRDAAQALVLRERGMRAAVSGPDGAYEIAGLAPGRYDLTPDLKEEGADVSRRALLDDGIVGDPGVVVVGGGDGGGSGGAGSRDGVATAPLDAIVDLVVVRRRSVRFEVPGPQGEPPSEARLDLRQAHATSWSLGDAPPRLSEGVYVVTGDARFAGVGNPPGEERIDLVPTAFVVEEDRDPPPVVLRAEAPEPILLVTVASDDPTTEDWYQVQVVVRRADGGAGPSEGRWQADDGLVTFADGTRGWTFGIDRVPSGSEPARFPVMRPPAGAYILEARRNLRPPDPPGARVPVTISGPSEPPSVALTLPPSDRSVRITVRARRADGGTMYRTRFTLEHRWIGRRSTLAGVEARTAGGEDPLEVVDGVTPEESAARAATASVTFSLRPADLAPEDGRAPPTLIAGAYTDGGDAESVVPPGRQVTVDLEVPLRARLTVSMDRSAHPTSAVDLLVEAQRPSSSEDPTPRRIGWGRGREQLADAAGKLTLEGMSLGPCVVVVQVRAAGMRETVELVRRAVDIAPGDNAVTIDLPPACGVSIEPDRAGTLAVYAADPRRPAEDVTTLYLVEAGRAVRLPPLPAGRYVAALTGASDPFGDPDLPPPRAVMTFDLPSEAATLPFGPALPTEGWAARVVDPVGEMLLRGDVVLAIDGVAVRDPWDPFAPDAPGPQSTPGVAQVSILRAGVPVVLEIGFSGRRGEVRDEFAPVPRGR